MDTRGQTRDNENCPIEIGMGMEIGQDQIDDIEDLQSPPNSPGLVLPVMVPTTNEKIDFFALDGTLHKEQENENSKNEDPNPKLASCYTCCTKQVQGELRPEHLQVVRLLFLKI